MIRKPKHLQPRIAVLTTGTMVVVSFAAMVGDNVCQVVEGKTVAGRISSFYGRAKVEGIEWI